jgi:Protein of unknown function (DUF1501)
LEIELRLERTRGLEHPNPGAFTIWLAGAGVKPGMSLGQTDNLGYEIVKDPIEVRDHVVSPWL